MHFLLSVCDKQCNISFPLQLFMFVICVEPTCTLVQAYFPVANNESSEVIYILLPVTFYFNPSTRLDNVKNLWRFVISFPVWCIMRVSVFNLFDVLFRESLYFNSSTNSERAFNNTRLCWNHAPKSRTDVIFNTKGSTETLYKYSLCNSTRLIKTKPLTYPNPKIITHAKPKYHYRGTLATMSKKLVFLGQYFFGLLSFA